MNKRLPILSFILLAFSLLILTGCGSSNDDDDNSSSSTNRGALVSSEEMANFDSTTIAAVLAQLGQSPTVAHSVTMHKVIYKTVDGKGNSVEASGIVSVPDNKTGASPLLSYQHGTIFEDADAPTNAPGDYPAVLLASSFGMIAVAADYVGYGESKGTLHPYLLAEPSANVSIDLIRAAKTFLSSKNIALNNQLFLSGYSEGGYATMALHKAIETSYSDELVVTTSLPASGPYDLTTTSAAIMASEQLPYPALIGFIFKSYADSYSLDDLLTRAFQEPYAAVIDTAFDGSKSGETINESLTTTTADLIAATFRSDYLGSGETELKSKLAANNVYNWTPKAPIRMFHGEEDLTVPYINSQNALTAMESKNADVTLTNCSASPSNHANCGPVFISFLLNHLLSNASDL